MVVLRTLIPKILRNALFESAPSRHDGEPILPGCMTRLVLVALMLCTLHSSHAMAQTGSGYPVAPAVERLKNGNARTRADAANTLGNMASNQNPQLLRELEATALTPLLHALTDVNASVREQSAYALRNLMIYLRKSNMKLPDVLPALTSALHDPARDVRIKAAEAVGQLGGEAGPAVPALIAMLGDPDGNIREAAAKSLGDAGAAPDLAVPALATILRSDPANTEAAEALARFGAQAKAAVPTLAALLAAPETRYGAATAMQGMGAVARPAVPALLAALGDENIGTRLEVAAALAGTGEHLADAREAEIAGLSGSDYRDRARAAGVIGDLGVDGAPALDDLARALNDRSSDVRRTAAFAIGRIAVALQQAGRTDAIPALKEVQAAIARTDDPAARTSGPNVKSAITALEKQRQQDPRYLLTWPLREQPVATGIVLGYLGLALGWLVLLRAAPLAVLRAAETLDKLPRPHMPGWLGGAEVSVSSLLLVGFLRHRDRVLDAWVARALGALPRTTGDDTPLERVNLDGGAVPVLGPESLRPLFSASRACLLVVGDPDWTARVASAVAIWAMARDKPRRLLPHAMLPVRLDEDLPPAEGVADPLVRAVRDRLPAECGSPSEPLVNALLRRQRVLVEVTDLSERGEATRAALRPGRPDFAAHAIVVTSRSDEALGGARRSILRAAA